MDPKGQVREGYDAASYAYRADDADDGQYRAWLGQLSEHLAPGARILDLGCGCGVPVDRWLVQRGFAVSGVDLSPVQVARARRLVPGGRFLCADMTRIKLPAGGFDAIVSFFAVIHVPLPQQPGLFRSMRQWMRPGGRLMATVGASPWTGTEDNWLGAGETMYWSHEGTDSYLRWLDEAGFDVDWHRFVPEANGGHTLLLARAAGRVQDQRIYMRRLGAAR